MKKFAEFKPAIKRSHRTYKVSVSQNDPSALNLFHVKVNGVSVAGKLEWVGTSIWNAQTNDWHIWQNALPVTKQELEQVLDLR